VVEPILGEADRHVIAMKQFKDVIEVGLQQRRCLRFNTAQPHVPSDGVLLAALRRSTTFGSAALYTRPSLGSFVGPEPPHDEE
jgi:hypothetical protein